MVSKDKKSSSVDLDLETLDSRLDLESKARSKF